MLRRNKCSSKRRRRGRDMKRKAIKKRIVEMEERRRSKGWRIRVMVVRKLVPILGTSSGKKGKLMGLARISLGRTWMGRESRRGRV